MDKTYLDLFKQLIAVQIGLNIRPKDHDRFSKTLARRMQALGIHEDGYLDLLNSYTPAADQEWQELASLLTIGESYFFRDEGQFDLLKNKLLPEMIEQNRGRRTLRLLSAGCSTGEEPYSLAILIDQILPKTEDWDVSIQGVDINQQALEQARRAEYRSWSFRALKSELQERYFHKTHEVWQLDPAIRSKVTFHHTNLLQAKWPDYARGIYDLDLVICRNVFIYFGHDSVATVTAKLASTLREGGYLITGHAELGNLAPPYLRAKIFSDSVVYQCNHQKKEKAASAPGAAVASASPTWQCSRAELHPSTTLSKGMSRASNANPAVFPLNRRPSSAEPKPSATNHHLEITQAQELFNRGDYLAVVAKLEPLLSNGHRHIDAFNLTGQALANLGLYDQAALICQQASEIDSLAAQPIYLLAQIRELQGDTEQAKVLLLKVIYLAPEFVAAYLDLAEILDGQNDRARATRMRRAAVELLQALPPQSKIEHYSTLTVDELAQSIQKSIES
jgi:chemotaxis protein methyltransferase CheR